MKPESVIFGPIKIRFSRNKTVQENLNRSGPAKNHNSESQVSSVLKVNFGAVAHKVVSSAIYEHMNCSAPVSVY